MDNNTINLSANLRIGEVKDAQTVISVSVQNDQDATQQIVNNIQSGTGNTPTNNDVWAHFAGVDAGTVSQLAGGIGIFGEPETFSADGGTWAKIDLNVVRQALPVPPLDQLPFVQSVIPGKAKVSFEITSDNTFHDSVDFKSNKGIAGTFSWLKSLKISLNATGNLACIKAIGEEAQTMQLMPDGIKSLADASFNAIEHVKFDMNFGSWDELSDELVQNITQAGNLEKFIAGSVAEMVASFGILFSNAATIYLVLNDNVHVSVTIKAPGVVEYAGLLQSN